jgi:hypothetical protein
VAESGGREVFGMGTMTGAFFEAHEAVGGSVASAFVRLTPFVALTRPMSPSLIA